MEKNIFEINKITCFVYANKNPEYFLIQPVNEPHAQMLDGQIRFMTEHTEKSFLVAAFLVKDWNQDLSPWCAPAVFGKESFGEGAGETLAFIEKMLIPEIMRRYKLEEDIKENDDWNGAIPDDSDNLERFSFYYVWIGYESDCGDNSGEYSYFSNEDMANDFFESSKNTDKTLGTASFINGRLEPVKVIKSTL